MPVRVCERARLRERERDTEKDSELNSRTRKGETATSTSTTKECAPIDKSVLPQMPHFLLATTVGDGDQLWPIRRVTPHGETERLLLQGPLQKFAEKVRFLSPRLRPDNLDLPSRNNPRFSTILSICRFPGSTFLPAPPGNTSSRSPPRTHAIKWADFFSLGDKCLGMVEGTRPNRFWCCRKGDALLDTMMPGGGGGAIKPRNKTTKTACFAITSTPLMEDDDVATRCCCCCCFQCRHPIKCSPGYVTLCLSFDPSVVLLFAEIRLSQTSAPLRSGSFSENTLVVVVVVAFCPVH